MDDWVRVRQLFELALEQDPADAAAWLEHRQEHPSAVRAEVLELLRHHREAGTFLANPLNESAVDGWADKQDLQVGEQVGPYRIVREIGRGGMGQVYLADDTRLQRTVALKALPAEATRHEVERERLRREARAAAALSHPGVCTVHALEEFEERLFIVSEFIEGRTLRQEIREDPLPTAERVADAAREIAAGLSAAHERGIVHRDLKPENIMRTADGRLKILDFGVAGAAPGADAGDRDRLTQPGVLIGTPGYMSPEQLKGETADERADVFAFGVVIYEYASGVHPFEAPTPLAVAARALEGSTQPIGSRRPDLPEQLVDVVNRCLRASASERYRSAANVLRALASPRPPPSPETPATVWWRTHQAIVIGLYATACVLLWYLQALRPGITTAIFVAAGVLATIGAIFRGHLMFTERVNRRALANARGRSSPVTLAVDVGVALGLIAAGLMLTAGYPILGVCATALGTGLGLTRLVLEPSTTSAAYPGPD